MARKVHQSLWVLNGPPAKRVLDPVRDPRPLAPKVPVSRDCPRAAGPPSCGLGVLPSTLRVGGQAEAEGGHIGHADLPEHPLPSSRPPVL